MCYFVSFSFLVFPRVCCVVFVDFKRMKIHSSSNFYKKKPPHSVPISAPRRWIVFPTEVERHFQKNRLEHRLFFFVGINARIVGAQCMCSKKNQAEQSKRKPPENQSIFFPTILRPLKFLFYENLLRKCIPQKFRKKIRTQHQGNELFLSTRRGGRGGGFWKFLFFV